MKKVSQTGVFLTFDLPVKEDYFFAAFFLRFLVVPAALALRLAGRFLAFLAAGRFFFAATFLVFLAAGRAAAFEDLAFLFERLAFFTVVMTDLHMCWPCKMNLTFKRM
jgi:hypothetical protein